MRAWLRAYARYAVQPVRVGAFLVLAVAFHLWRDHGFTPSVVVLLTAWTLVVLDRRFPVAPPIPWRWTRRRGCCGACAGEGTDPWAPETGGRCWDCYATGHCHDPAERCRPPWWRRDLVRRWRAR